MKFKFNYRGREVELDVKICRNIFSQGLGLMFGFRRKSLLFVFKNKKRRAIHSFFCKPFYAIWFDGDRIVDGRLVDGWRINIRSLEKFDKLLEILSGTDEFELFRRGKV